MTVRLALSLITYAPTRVGGSETYLRGLLEGLDRVGCSADVLVNALGAERLQSTIEETQHRFEVADVPLRADGRPRFRWLGANAVPRGRWGRRMGAYDAVHYPATVPIPRGSGAAWIVTLHDVQHLDMPEHTPPHYRAWRHLTYDRAATHASRVITVSSHAKGRICERLGIPEDRVSAIPHGLDESLTASADPVEDARLLAPLDIDRPYLLYPAGLWPHKNHSRLLEAVKLMGRKDFLLLLSGPTFDAGHNLEQEIVRLGLSGQVRHLGFQSRETLHALLRQARGLVFPSLYEGFGSPPLEAMKSGTATAVSRVASLPEVCGEASLYFDPLVPEAIAESMRCLLDDEAARQDLIVRGRDQALKFTWERSAAGHVQAYADAVAGGTV